MLAVENVVPQHHGHIVIADEFFSQDKGLGQSVGRRLFFIAQPHPVLAAIPQQFLEVGQIHRGGDDQDILDPRQHQGGQGVVDHGFVVNGKQLFAGNHGQGVQPGAGAACQNDSFHTLFLRFISLLRMA